MDIKEALKIIAAFQEQLTNLRNSPFTAAEINQFGIAVGVVSQLQKEKKIEK